MKIYKFLKPSLRIGLLAILLITSSGCSSLFQTPAPTQDAAALVKAAVSTMHAQLTQSAIDHPSPTPTATATVTATPLPTETPLPSETPTPEMTLTPSATSEFVAGFAAKLQYITVFPQNSFIFIPNEHFNVAIGFKNVGSITWAPGSSIVKVNSTGGVFTGQPKATTGKTVAPGQKVEFDLWGFGSEDVGTHSWMYQLYTQGGGAVPGGFAVFTYTSH